MHEFHQLLQYLFEEYFHDFPDQLVVWAELTYKYWRSAPDSLKIYIRYIGQTGRTAWRRYKEDLDPSLTSGLNRTFIQTCQNHFPQILAEAQIHEFHTATIDFELKTSQRRVADTREQALIAVFGPQTLLNSSVGGFDAVIEHDQTDRSEFEALLTKSIKHLEWHAEVPEDTNAIAEYGDKIQAFTTENQDSTNALSYPITDEVKALLIKQATPAMVNGHTILLTVGCDMAVNGYQSKKPFFHGGLRSSEITTSVLNDMVQRELGYSTTKEYRVASLHDQNFLPFVDLFPWAKKDMQDLK